MDAQWEGIEDDVPRKGNVDRNSLTPAAWTKTRRTFPARGTWIEIIFAPPYASYETDVPRKGNVDRNSAFRSAEGMAPRRSPQGERG